MSRKQLKNGRLKKKAERSGLPKIFQIFFLRHFFLFSCHKRKQTRKTNKRNKKIRLCELFINIGGCRHETMNECWYCWYDPNIFIIIRLSFGMNCTCGVVVFLLIYYVTEFFYSSHRDDKQTGAAERSRWKEFLTQISLKKIP